jgi:excisionase family DNA binding protein
MTTPRILAAVAELTEALAEAVRLEAASVPAAPDRLLSVDEAAHTLGIGRSRLYVEIGKGHVRSISSGRRRLIPASAITKFVERSA